MIIKITPTTVIFQQPPSRRTIYYSGMKYFLSFPYIIFKINYKRDRDKKYFYFKNLQLAFSDGVNLFYPCLTNVYIRDNEGNILAVCLGRITTVFKTFDEMCGTIVNTFWNKEFNNSLESIITNIHNSHPIEFFNEWHKKTKSNANWSPDFLKKLPLDFMKEFE